MNCYPERGGIVALRKDATKSKDPYPITKDSYPMPTADTYLTLIVSICAPDTT